MGVLTFGNVRNICVTTGGWAYLHLVGRGQGHCPAPSDAQDSLPAAENGPAQGVCSVWVRNPGMRRAGNKFPRAISEEKS